VPEAMTVNLMSDSPDSRKIGMANDFETGSTTGWEGCVEVNTACKGTDLSLYFTKF